MKSLQVLFLCAAKLISIIIIYMCVCLFVWLVSRMCLCGLDR